HGGRRAVSVPGTGSAAHGIRFKTFGQHDHVVRIRRRRGRGQAGRRGQERGQEGHDKLSQSAFPQIALHRPVCSFPEILVLTDWTKRSCFCWDEKTENHEALTILYFLTFPTFNHTVL